MLKYTEMRYLLRETPFAIFGKLNGTQSN